MKDKFGLAFGRFQPFHIGHLEYISVSLGKCEKLLIGITNPDPMLTQFTPKSKHRSLSSANPFSYYERLIMIRDSLNDYGIRNKQFELIPLPINYPENIQYYLPRQTVIYLSIFEEWGYEKMEIFKRFNYKTKVLFEEHESNKLASGKEIRRKIADGGSNWCSLVPNAVKVFIMNNNLEKKVSMLFHNDSGWLKDRANYTFDKTDDTSQ